VIHEILIVNPTKKRRKNKAKKAKSKTSVKKRTVNKKVAKKKAATRTALSKGVNSMPKKRKKARKNPTKKRRRYGAAVKKTARKAARRMTAGLNFKSAIKNMIPIQLGMFAAKWLAKRWSDGATEGDPGSWSMMDYVKGAGGAGVAALLLNMVKPGWGQKALEGGLNLMVYKAVQNELIAPNTWATEQFGEEDYIPDEYLMTGMGDADGWGYAEDGTPIPLDDRHRMPVAGYGYGDSLVTPGPLGEGGSLYPVGPMGETDDEFARAYSLQ
jgi:hypothetical protein